jgi:hypothetical protein
MAMKQVSFWAKNHKISARITIIFAYFLLNITSLFAGDILHSINVIFNSFFCLAAMFLTIVGVLIYPSGKNKSRYKNFYFRHKMADGILILATFLFLVYSGNSINENRIRIFQPAYGISIITPRHPEANSYSVPKASSVSSKKELRRNFLKKLREIRKKYKGATKTEKTLLIILAIIAAGFLMSLLLALSCSIACSGSEALAFIVGIIGAGAIIFGVIKLIQRITRGKPQKEKAEPIQ